MSARLDGIKRLEDAGCAAIVLHSLFEEQITMAATGRIHHRDPLDQEFAESLSPFMERGEAGAVLVNLTTESAVRAHSGGSRQFSRRRRVRVLRPSSSCSR
jgi:hypothetical protein